MTGIAVVLGVGLVIALLRIHSMQRLYKTMLIQSETIQKQRKIIDDLMRKIPTYRSGA